LVTGFFTTMILCLPARTERIQWIPARLLRHSGGRSGGCHSCLPGQAGTCTVGSIFIKKGKAFSGKGKAFLRKGKAFSGKEEAFLEKGKAFPE